PHKGAARLVPTVRPAEADRPTDGGFPDPGADPHKGAARLVPTVRLAEADRPTDEAHSGPRRDQPGDYPEDVVEC
ncbi:MAG: hypothetical protein HKM06_04345, partial [Spirochaetales bacterium]|nr:hypothetical protein [Spirochaetales bacterium]